MLLALFTAAAEINAALWADCIDSGAMSVDEFKDFVSQRLGYDIQFKLVDVETETEFVHGHIERYDGEHRAIIYIVKTVDRRQRRQVGVKELCQLVLDIEEDWSTAGEDTLSRLATPQVEIGSPDNIAYRSEYLAEILSWELLYPHELRKVDRPKLDAGEVSIEEIGHKRGVPNDTVAILLARNYLDWCDQWWALVVKRLQASE
jgi:hypothetical protein